MLKAIDKSSQDLIRVKRALISVFNKSNLERLAVGLNSLGIEIVSTGGTAKAISAMGIKVIEVSDLTGFPGLLDDRVKTLHPNIFGGILAVRTNSTHCNELAQYGIPPIDLVVVDLYPFSEAVQRDGDVHTCVENIDVGGLSLLRAAAKNFKYVAAVSSPHQYNEVLTELMELEGSCSMKTRKALAACAFDFTSKYDKSIANYIASTERPIGTVSRSYSTQINLKYGCNPHQQPAAVYSIQPHKFPFTVLDGTPGYINFLDACNGWQLVRELDESLKVPAATSFKHCSPAGAALGIPTNDLDNEVFEVPKDLVSQLSNTAAAVIRARNADNKCSYGDFIAVSRTVDEVTAKYLKNEVSDGIVAPAYEPAALEILCEKKKGSFVILQVDPHFEPSLVEFREIFGIALSQKRNDAVFNPNALNETLVTGSSSSRVRQEDVSAKDEKTLSDSVMAGTRTEEYSLEALRDMVLAAVTTKYTQSNSVGYAYGGQMIGIGAGQQSRVDCVKLAGAKAAMWYLRRHPKVLGLQFKPMKHHDRINARVRYIEGEITEVEWGHWVQSFERVPDALITAEKKEFLRSLKDVALCSDGFFPFRDSIDEAYKCGVKHVVQPGGSVFDQDVITACQEYGMLMSFTDIRTFHH